MTDAHARFRASLAAHLAEVLPVEEASWMEAHARDCPSCAGLMSRVRDRLPEVADDADHVPVSVLERWVRAPDRFTALERRLLEGHLASCATCREEVEEMARLAGVPQALTPRVAGRIRRFGPVGAGLVAAAALVAVFLVRRSDFTETGEPRAPTTQAPSSVLTRGAMMPPPGRLRVLELLDRTRTAAAGRVPETFVPAADESLRLRLPPLFITESDSVVARLLRADGGSVWEARLPETALRKPLAPSPPAGGWLEGRYRLLVIPGAGQDTIARREFVFRLVAPKAP